MEDQLKKRLIGATVLVSLAVIFIPMLLEREPVIDSGITGTNIPPKPKPIVPDSLLPADRGVSIEPPKQLELVKPIAIAKPAPEPEPEPEPVTPNPVESKPAMVEEPPKETQPEPEKVEPVQAPPASISAPSWVIQIGSFSNRANAEKLVEELKVLKYQAFMETADVNKSSLYRVRIGPDADKTRLEKLLVNVNEDLKSKNIRGRVTSYP